jgi:hypothetical protein
VSGDPLRRLRAADPLRGELPTPLARMPARPARRRRTSTLTVANLVLLATVLFHAVDHTLIQPRGIGPLSFEVMVGGMAITATAAMSLAIAMRGDRRAPLVALLSGPWVAIAVFLGHFMGHLAGPFSDPYSDAHLATISYAGAIAVVVAGVVLGGVGVATNLRARSAAG